MSRVVEESDRGSKGVAAGAQGVTTARRRRVLSVKRLHDGQAPAQEQDGPDGAVQASRSAFGQAPPQSEPMVCLGGHLLPARSLYERPQDHAHALEQALRSDVTVLCGCRRPGVPMMIVRDPIIDCLMLDGGLIHRASHRRDCVFYLQDLANPHPADMIDSVIATHIGADVALSKQLLGPEHRHQADDHMGMDDSDVEGKRMRPRCTASLEQAISLIWTLGGASRIRPDMPFGPQQTHKKAMRGLRKLTFRGVELEPYVYHAGLQGQAVRTDPEQARRWLAFAQAVSGVDGQDNPLEPSGSGSAQGVFHDKPLNERRFRLGRALTGRLPGRLILARVKGMHISYSGNSVLLMLQGVPAQVIMPMARMELLRQRSDWLVERACELDEQVQLPADERSGHGFVRRLRFSELPEHVRRDRRRLQLYALARVKACERGLSVTQIALMACHASGMPVASRAELDVVDRLIEQGRPFSRPYDTGCSNGQGFCFGPIMYDDVDDESQAAAHVALLGEQSTQSGCQTLGPLSTTGDCATIKSLTPTRVAPRAQDLLPARAS